MKIKGVYTYMVGYFATLLERRVYFEYFFA